MKSLFQMAAHGLCAAASEMASMALLAPVLTQVSALLSVVQVGQGGALAAPDQPGLILSSSEMKIRMLGAIANVVVTRHYRNEGKATQAALYVGNAGLYSIKLRLGRQLLRAHPRPKAPARIVLRIARIRPGAEFSLELRYTHLLAAVSAAHPKNFSLA